MQKITISGNLGKDAEVKKLESGRNCIYFNVAVNAVKKQEGTKVTQTQWYSVSYFVNSEAILQYLKTGTKVVVCGNLDLDIFKSEKSQKVYVNANILATDVEIVGFVDAEPQPKQAAPPMPEEEPDFL